DSSVLLVIQKLGAVGERKHLIEQKQRVAVQPRSRDLVVRQGRFGIGVDDRLFDTRRLGRKIARAHGGCRRRRGDDLLRAPAPPLLSTKEERLLAVVVVRARYRDQPPATMQQARVAAVRT